MSHFINFWNFWTCPETASDIKQMSIYRMSLEQGSTVKIGCRSWKLHKKIPMWNLSHNWPTMSNYSWTNLKWLCHRSTKPTPKLPRCWRMMDSSRLAAPRPSWSRALSAKRGTVNRCHGTHVLLHQFTITVKLRHVYKRCCDSGPGSGSGVRFSAFWLFRIGIRIL